MVLMSRTTGLNLGDDIKHLEQSIVDIITTPLGTRVMLPEYGSTLIELLSSNITPALLGDIRAAIATALDRWEPRFELTEINFTVEDAEEGILIIDMQGLYKPTEEFIRLDGITVQRAES